MEAKLQRRIQRYGWDKAAHYYEGFWQQQLKPAHTRLLEHAQLQKGEQVLDIACGTGLVTMRAAAAVGQAGRVVATDISEGMVELAGQTAKERGFENVSFKRMDAEELLLSDVTFDAALDSLGLMYVPDPIRALQEMHRVLKPGGRAVAAVWGHRKNCGWAEIFPIVDSRVNSDVCPLFFQLGTGDLLAKTFEQAGFTEVVTEHFNTVLNYDSDEAACGAAFVGGPVAMAYSRFDDSTRAAAHAEYLTSIELYKNGTGYRIPGEFVVVKGAKKLNPALQY